MPADRRAIHEEFIPTFAYCQQRQVSGAAADVAHENPERPIVDLGKLTFE
jgi:hypothetical protein